MSEVLDTEADYVENLNELVSRFMNPLEDLNILPEENFNQIFGNVENIRGLVTP